MLVLSHLNVGSLSGVQLPPSCESQQGSPAFVWCDHFAKNFCLSHNTKRCMPSRGNSITPSCIAWNKSGVASSPSREVTPNRTNSNSLDDTVQAQLILNINQQSGANPGLHTHIWHPKLLDGFNQDKVHKRFCCLVAPKCLGKGPRTFANSLEWAI